MWIPFWLIVALQELVARDAANGAEFNAACRRHGASLAHASGFQKSTLIREAKGDNDMCRKSKNVRYFSALQRNTKIFNMWMLGRSVPWKEWLRQTQPSAEVGMRTADADRQTCLCARRSVRSISVDRFLTSETECVMN